MPPQASSFEFQLDQALFAVFALVNFSGARLRFAEVSGIVRPAAPSRRHRRRSPRLPRDHDQRRLT